MRVLIVITSANRRSSFGNVNYNEQEVGLAKALIKRGIKCGIAYYGGDQEKREDYDIGIGTIEMYLLKGKDFLKTAVFKNYSSLYEKYDILMPISYDHYETYHLAMRYPHKTVVYHGTYYSTFNIRYNFKCAIFDKLILPGYRKANTLFVTKNRLSEAFLNKKGLNNTQVIGVGFDADQMESSKLYESDLSRKIKTFKDEGNKVILYVGRIEPRRNTIFLLEVFKKITEVCKVKLVIIGNGTEAYKDKCKEIACLKNIDPAIIYQQKLEQKYLPQIYNMADLFLLPTSYDIFGMVILEAMYFGTPILTTKNGGSDILIENGKSGYIISELDIEQWFKKSVEILNSDTVQLTKEAHRKIAEEFTWDVLVDKFIDVFNRKINGD